MIRGIGTDIVDSRRVAKLLGRFGDKFVARLCNAEERAALPPLPPAAMLAKRFAAKEAALKALGTGLAAGWRFHDITVRHNAAGKPALSIPKAGQTARFHLSLADEPPYALAFVVMEYVDAD